MFVEFFLQLLGHVLHQSKTKRDSFYHNYNNTVLGTGATYCVSIEVLKIIIFKYNFVQMGL